MVAKAKFKCDAFEAVQSPAFELQSAGTINEATMRGFDETCLAAPPAIAPLQIKRLCE